VVDGKEDYIPVDVTNGDAIKVAEAKPSLLEHIRQGGFVMVPLAAVALIALILCIWKTLELSGIQTNADDTINAIMEMLKQSDVDKALENTNMLRDPLLRMVKKAIAHRGASRDYLEEVLHEQVLATVPKLERNLGTLAVLGGIAPLLGLLGTVTGMIHTFQLVTIFGSGNAKLLSGGISEALVTTETGLAIAIPVLLLHAFLARRARTIIASLEHTALRIVNEIKTESDV
jgi:biopolymer transport protein ExbB